MESPPSDLVTLLSEARQLVSDDRYIWCTVSDTFQSRIVCRGGLLLGGAYSPHFLRDTTPGSWDIPLTMQLRHCRVIVCSEAGQQPLAAWLPLMEAIAGSGESLLVVTETIDAELLKTFVVNTFKGSLRVCVCHPLRDRSGNAPPGSRFAVPPASPDQLLRIDDVLVRRTATACFPAVNEPLASAGALQNFVVIETGGEDHEDQFSRIRFLMRELQQS